MYYAYAAALYLFVLVITAFVLKMCCRTSAKKRGYVLLPVFEKDDIKAIEKTVKELNYEELINGRISAREIIIADASAREEELRMIADRYITAVYIPVSELSEYIDKKECNDE